MPHRFVAAGEVESALEAVSPKRMTPDLKTYMNIVKVNKKWMQQGCLTTPEGDQALPPVENSQCFCASSDAEDAPQNFEVTNVCVADVDTLTAALMIGNACALNFANASVPGGGYTSGSKAQEEDLCRLLPQLHPTLHRCRYPIVPGTAYLSRPLLAVRRPGFYEPCQSLGECSIITAAMPCREARAGSPAWRQTVSLRMRAVLLAAKGSLQPNLVLGAWGCGAFGNPPSLVAELFTELLASPEFRGAFDTVVFAIIDPKKDGNIVPFRQAIARLVEEYS
eukprot:TRINITY_DN25155_c0_g1_i1.p1 TRINITY_DN25155_c0_g1~~TRINITY_DN25155_c0_g1_i1.p1  ORF type:complete len:280 (+),score=35.23 TRINITY_DN25155_c0_g1_i1:116-955(+)